VGSQDVRLEARNGIAPGLRRLACLEAGGVRTDDSVVEAEVRVIEPQQRPARQQHVLVTPHEPRALEHEERMAKRGVASP